MSGVQSCMPILIQLSWLALSCAASSCDTFPAAEYASLYFADIVSSTLESEGFEQISFSCLPRALAQSKLAAFAGWVKMTANNRAATPLPILRKSICKPPTGSALSSLARQLPEQIQKNR